MSWALIWNVLCLPLRLDNIDISFWEAIEDILFQSLDTHWLFYACEYPLLQWN